MNSRGIAEYARAALVALSLGAAALAGAGCQSAPPTCPASAPVAACTRVLFLGNSYTYVNDLPSTFASLAASGKHQVQVAMVANGGETLSQHDSSAESLDRISSQHWDYVVLQEQSETPALAGSRDSGMYPAARTLAARIKSAGAVPMLFMTWAHRDGLPSAGLSTYEAMQRAIDQSYVEIAHELSVPVAPVGYTWYIVRHDHPEIVLWQDDGSHPSSAGTYLGACVFYASIFRQSPEGLAFHGGVDAGQAAVLQAEASRNVLQQQGEWGLR